ncbi:MAG: pyridoxamine 5'-phosphate oxidase family protein [Candidatus Riflebacteria bacterium]|nr:pyridoxamine 5'-phosphate oxidase family protein [Candidatus Riflebacteria bacterium]
MPNEDAWATLRELVRTQDLAVLGTDGDGHPYTSLVAFDTTEDLRGILFATSRETRKYRNLRGNPRVSLLIDNRSHSVADFQRAAAVTVQGTLCPMESPEEEKLRDHFQRRHPHLREFVGSVDCALVKIKVDRYFLVRRFQEVLELVP